MYGGPPNYGPPGSNIQSNYGTAPAPPGSVVPPPGAPRPGPPGGGFPAFGPPGSAPMMGGAPPGAPATMGGVPPGAPPMMGGGPGGAPATMMGGPPGAPPMMGGGPHGAPATMMGGPPAMGAPPRGSAPPASTMSASAPAAPAPPKSNVMFFSTAGGTPVPTAATGGTPPPVSMAGPPTGAPPMTSTGPPMVGPPGAGSMPPPSMQNVGGMMPPGPPGQTLASAMPPGAPHASVTTPGGGMMMAPGSMAGTMPVGFDSGANLASMSGSAVPGAPADPNNPAAAGASTAAPLPLLDEMDLSIQCNPAFMQATVTKIVNNQAAASASRIPLGLVCKPMAGDVGIDNEEIEVVDFGATGIVRCKRCRTYINPFVTWADNGRRWRCNICGMLNDVPSTYFSHLDQNGQRRDKDQRPELSRCSVEFVAPGDYMVRPPQPPVYFFVIDVSEAAITSGMIQNCVNAIKASLDDLPGSLRTQIGFITFDTHIHFYNLKSTLTAPQMLVVSDISDVIMPLPEDLLVNLQDSRAVVDNLLDSLPSMFKTPTSTQSNTCTGPALMAAKRVIQHLGGKLCLFQCSLPTIGEGALKIRENPRLLGTDKEHIMLNAEDPWYKTNAIDFSRLQISVDCHLFSSQYTDLATISVLSKYTAGSCYYYPAFHGPRDGLKFESDLKHNLTRATAFEAVMRVRATRGLRFSNFYGNYFIRGTDLLALPNCTSDSSFSLDIAYDEAHLSAQAITIQAALLYTNAIGERRIRVHTMVLPVTQSVVEMTETLDIDCAMNVLAKQAIDISQKTGLENARQRINQVTVEIMRSAKAATTPATNHAYGMPGQPSPSQGATTIPSSLLLLPLYSMSLQKSTILRGGTDVRIDERAYFQHLLNNMDIEESKVFIYPRLFSIHDMTADCGIACDNADEDCPTAGPMNVRLPSILNLSYERLSSNGIFLLENGHDMFIWIGRSSNPAIINTLFGVNSLDNIDMSMLKLLPETSDFSSRVDTIINALRQDRARYMQLHFIREGDGYAEVYFARYLVEDRANFSGGGLSYTEYHAHVSRSMSGLPG